MLYENVRFGTICSVAFGTEDATQKRGGFKIEQGY